MKFLEWLDERKMLAVILPVGAISLLHELVLEHDKLDSETITLLSLGLGGLIAAITLMAQSIYKTGQTEQAQARTIAALANAANPSPSPDKPPFDAGAPTPKPDPNFKPGETLSE